MEHVVRKINQAAWNATDLQSSRQAGKPGGHFGIRVNRTGAKGVEGGALGAWTERTNRASGQEFTDEAKPRVA